METTPPSHSKGRQLAQTSGEMMVNMVPVFGGTIAVALTVALNHKLNKRRERWFTELAEVVEELRDRFDGFDPESLAENEAFVDAVVTGTRIVDRTSQREKIEVLRNAVVNSALPAAPDQDIQQLYFALIDDLTPTPYAVVDPAGQSAGMVRRPARAAPSAVRHVVEPHRIDQRGDA